MDKAQAALKEANKEFLAASKEATQQYKDWPEKMTFRQWLSQYGSEYNAAYNKVRASQATFDQALIDCEGPGAVPITRYRNTLANVFVETAETPGYV
jgi:hypothetical protein